MQWCQPLRACAHLEVAARQRETREGWGWAEVLQNRQEAGAVLNESSSRAYPHTSTRKVWEDTHVCTSVCASSHTSKVAMARILVRQYSEHKHTDTRARARACTHTHTQCMACHGLLSLESLHMSLATTSPLNQLHLLPQHILAYISTPAALLLSRLEKVFLPCSCAFRGTLPKIEAVSCHT